MLLDSSFPPDIRVESEALSLLRAGHSVSVLCYNFEGQPSQIEYKGIKVTGLPIKESWAKKIIALMHIVPFYKWFWKDALRKTLKKEKYDAIHIHDLPLSFLFGDIPIDREIKKLIDLHENFPYLMEQQAFMKKFPWKYILSSKSWFDAERKWLKNADRIICVDENMKKRIASMVNNIDDIIVVPNTISIDSFVKAQQSRPEVAARMAGTYNLVYIGGIDSTRGLETLVEATDQLQGKINNLKVWIVGSGSGYHNIRALIDRRGLQDLIVMEGNRPQSEIGTYLSQAHICIIPHLKTPHTDNTSANKLFQYMYYGKPIVSSNCLAIERVIQDAKCGEIFESGNTSDLVQKIIKIFDNPALAASYGENAKMAVEKKYNWAVTVKPMLEMYQML